jgi:hypothetical protein
MTKTIWLIGFTLIVIVLIGCQPEPPQEYKKVKSNDTTKVLSNTPNKNFISNKYITHNPLGLTVDLPEHLQLVKENSKPSIDYGDYNIILEDGYVIGEIHSLTNGRFLLDTITDFYESAQNNPSITISYKAQSDNWFVVSGTNKETGNIIYWKRIVSEPYISDLEFEYPPKRRQEIEPYLGRISRSFQDD